MAKQIPPVGPENIGPIKPQEQKPVPDKSQFQSAMNEPRPAPGAPPSSASQVSPLNLPQSNLTAEPSIDSLLAQMWESEHTFDELQKNLKTKNLKFKRSEQNLMRNKLSEANTHLMSAAEKVGAKVLPSEPPPSGFNPIERFLQLATNGGKQLQEAKQKIIDLQSAEGEELRPGDMMLVQVKLAQAQQSLEYASTLLSKAVDVIKQMINVQL